MNIWIGGDVDSDIYENFRVARNFFEKELTRIFKQQQWDDQVLEIRLLFVVREGGSSFPSNPKFIKREKVIEFDSYLDYNEIRNSSLYKIIEMIKTKLSADISIMSNNPKLPDYNYYAISEIINSLKFANYNES